MGCKEDELGKIVSSHQHEYTAAVPSKSYGLGFRYLKDLRTKCKICMSESTLMLCTSISAVAAFKL